MLYRLTDAFNRARFDAACRGVLDTPPVVLCADSPLTVVSQLQHKDLIMYLLAVKSFARRVEVGSVAILNDGTLTVGDLEVLRRHVPGARLLAIDDYRSAACPRGGCWERLLAICELAQERYVVQLDSDTLTLSVLPEVTAGIRESSSFTIGTWDGQELETMAERVDRAKRLAPRPEAHVQIVAEANFDKLHRFRELRYVRGCAGFSAFAKGSLSREFVESISSEMLAAIGQKWQEWGSEQVMSNIAVANSPSARVLPHPKYADCQKMQSDETVFVHFIGSCRFRGNGYSRLGRVAIEELGQSRSDPPV